MLLIMIKLKEVYPDVIESFMKDEVSILQSPVLLPKERELLLRLLISYLPPPAVLSFIQNSHLPSNISIIHSLCHLPVDVLLEEYLTAENGLLNTDDSLVIDSIVDLLTTISRHSSHFQRIQLIQLLFKRMHKSKKNTIAFLKCIASLLENTYYITSSSEQELLVQFAQEEALREASLGVLSRCVLPTMKDVKSIGEATHTTQMQWVGQSLLNAPYPVSSTPFLLNTSATNTPQHHRQVQIAKTIHVLRLFEYVRRCYASRPRACLTNRHIAPTHLRQLVQTLDLREARAAHHVADHRLARNHHRLLRGLPVPLHRRAFRARHLRLPTPHSPRQSRLQRAGTSHVASNTPADVHANHALEGVRAAVVHLEARRRQGVGEQVVQREAQLAAVPVRHQRVLLLLGLRVTPHACTHRLLVVAAVHALLHLLRLTPPAHTHALDTHAQHAQVVDDRHVLCAQLARRQERLPRRRRQLLGDGVDQHQTDLLLTRGVITHLVLLTTSDLSPPHSPQVLA